MNETIDKPANNPFAGAQVAARPSGNAVAQSDQSRAVAEVQAAMMIARMNPRDPIAAMDRILNACTRPTLADSAVYTYSRGGSDVSGPSIRLAEAMAQSWGNMQFGIRELDQRNGESTVQAFAWDVETNTRREVTFQVPHIRYTRQGSKKLEDPRDIYEMVANQGARRLRACILAVIPGDVTEAAVAQCEVTMKTKADTGPEAMQKMVVAFEPFGVTKEQIEKRIQRRLDAIQPAQVVSLKKIYASLRDGMSVASDWFEAETPEAGQHPASSTDKVKEKLRSRGQGKEGSSSMPPGVDQETGEITDQNSTAGSSAQATPGGAGAAASNPSEYADEIKAIADCQSIGDLIKLMNSLPAKIKKALHADLEARQAALKPVAVPVTYAVLAERLQKSTDLDVLDADADLIKELPEDQQADLSAIYHRRRAELEG